MARPGVSDNKDEVFNVCRKIQERGTRPNSINVRAELGTGSLSTLKRLVDEFHEKQTLEQREAAVRAVNTPPLPADLEAEFQAALAKVWARAHEEAAQETARVRTSLQVRLDQAEATQNDTKAELTAVTTEIDKLEGEVERLTAEAKQKESEHASLQGELQLLKRQLEQASHDNAALVGRAAAAEESARRESEARIHQQKQFEADRDRATDLNKRLESELSSLRKDAQAQAQRFGAFEGELAATKQRLVERDSEAKDLLSRAAQAEKELELLRSSSKK